jgi:murein DD-endopeptidase MepM/ murein hydrolase activator NlpD
MEIRTHDSVAPGTEEKAVAGLRIHRSYRSVGALLIATLCLFGSANFTLATSKKKYKSLPRLQVGLKSVQDAKSKSQARLTTMRKEITLTESKIRALKSQIKQQEVGAPEVNDQLESLNRKLKLAREAKDKVLSGMPSDCDEMKEYLSEMIENGEGRYVAFAFAGHYDQPTTFTRQDLRDELKAVESTKMIRMGYDKFIGRIQKQLREMKDETGASVDRVDSYSIRESDLKTQLSKLQDEEETLIKKIKKCETDEKNIRAEIRVVSEQKQDETDDQHDDHEDSKKSDISPSTVTFKNLFRPVAGRVTSLYGLRMHPILKEERVHKGLDLAGQIGDPVYSANGGTVAYAGPANGYGNLIVIDHPNGFSTAYGHLSEILVAVGDKVKRGKIVGAVGNVGMSTGPHLHFEVRVNGKPVDPLPYL